MSNLDRYVKELKPEYSAALEHVIALVRSAEISDIEEGVSYGYPAFKYNGRPLIGFGHKKGVLSLYPFDPSIVATLRPELTDFDVGKGYIRFNPDHMIPDDIILLFIELRIAYLKGSKS